MRAALAQMQPGAGIDESRQKAVRWMETAASRGAELIVFPEVALHGFFPQYRDDPSAAERAEPIPGPTTHLLVDAARSLSLVTVFNLYEVDGEGRYFDSSPVIDADGTLLGVTRMVHIAELDLFHEQAYYHPGDSGARVYETRAGRVGVAICYDRHYPEYMRAMGIQGAQIVVIPQAGAVGEWPDGLFQAEVRTAAFQNGYFAALCNRVGREEHLCFAGESFVVDPAGTVLAQAAQGEQELLIVDCDLAACDNSPARRFFWRDRRPELYGKWFA
jgi:N-carbamoylputrescine amidase